MFERLSLTREYQDIAEEMLVITRETRAVQRRVMRVLMEKEQLNLYYLRVEALIEALQAICDCGDRAAVAIARAALAAFTEETP